jgi:transcription initiation factor IIF auxiliary subunit
MKEWTVEIYILDQDGKEKPARCFTKAVYHLHPSFANPVQSMRPYTMRLLEVYNTDTPGSLHGAAL